MKSFNKITREDISIAGEHLGDYDYSRCVESLWNVYNLIQDARKVDEFGISLPLSVLSKVAHNASFADESGTSLIYTSEGEVKFHNDGKFGHQYGMEQFGFVFSDIETKTKKNPTVKPNMNSVTRLILTHDGQKYKDVIYGLKFFADVCAKYETKNRVSMFTIFAQGDVQVASQMWIDYHEKYKNHDAKKESFEECCDRLFFDQVLKNGMAKLYEIFLKLKMKPSGEGGKYTCSYKGNKVMYFNIYDRNSVTLDMSFSTDNSAEELREFFASLPEDLKAEFALNTIRRHGCPGLACSKAYELEYSGVKYVHCLQYSHLMICEPTAEQFDMLERLIMLRREWISDTAKSSREVK